jgi:hypothetical protein
MLGKLSDFQTHTLTSPALLSAKDLELNFIFNLSVVSVQACHCQTTTNCNVDYWICFNFYPGYYAPNANFLNINNLTHAIMS